MKENFEDYINKKADGFKLEPDAKLWSAIDKKINKKRKRRFIIWWFFAGVMITASGLLLIKSNSSSHKIKRHKKEKSVVQENKVVDENTLYIKEGEKRNDKPSDKQIQMENSRTAHYPSHKKSSHKQNHVRNSTVATAAMKDSSKMPSELPVIFYDEVKEIDVVTDSSQDSIPSHENDLPVDEKKDSTSTPADSLAKDKEESTDSILHGKWSVGISVFGGYGFNAFNENNNRGNIASYHEKNTKDAVALSPGVFIYYQLSKNLEIGGGVEYTSIREITTNKQPLYKNDTVVIPTSSVPSYNVVTVLSSGLVDSSKSSSAEVTNTYYYLSFPLCLNYKFLQSGKFSAGLNVKLAYNMLLASDHFENNYPEREFSYYSGGKKGSLRKGGISAGLGISVDYMIAKKIGVFVSPEFRKNFYSLYKSDYIFDQYHSAAGLSFGFRYFFK